MNWINGRRKKKQEIQSTMFSTHLVFLLTASIQFQITISNTALIRHTIEVYESRTQRSAEGNTFACEKVSSVKHAQC